MATSDPVRLLQEEVTCAVCLDYLHEPVTIDCGHNFCRACITRCWDEMGRRFPCPQCRARSPKRKLRPNCQLANVAMAAKRLRSNASEDAAPGPGTSVSKSQEATETKEAKEAKEAKEQDDDTTLSLAEEEAPKVPEEEAQEAQEAQAEWDRPPKAAGEPETASADNKPEEEAPPGEAESTEAHKGATEAEEARDGTAEARPEERARSPHETAEAAESTVDETPEEAREPPGTKAAKEPRPDEDSGQDPGAESSLTTSPADSGQWAEPRPGRSLPQSPCPLHPGEELWLFCRWDGATLCPACRPEMAHYGHDLVALAEEGRATRARLRGALGRLRAQRKALENAGAQQEHQVAHLGEEAAIRRQHLGDEFEGLRHFLSKAEQDLLGSLATAERQAQAARRARGARLSANARRLDRLLLEASAWLHLPSTRLLGDSSVQEGLQRLEAEARKSLGARVGPGEGLGGAGRAQAVLKAAARAFRERLAEELERDDPPVRFDINSAALGLEVSEGGRMVRLGHRPSSQPPDLCPCILGDKAWQQGSHYWEVDVSQSRAWAVGVACEGDPRPQPNKGLWVLQLSRGQLWTPEVTLAIRPQPQRLAVFLEMEAGLLAFSDAQSGAPVHSYQGTDWGQEATLRPCFWLWDLGGSLRLSP